MLIGWITAVIGIVIVVFSLNQLIREIRKAGIPNMEDQSFSDTYYKLLNRVDQLGENLDDINQTFYESTERLEKRIEVLERKTTKMENTKKPTREPFMEQVGAHMPEGVTERVVQVAESRTSDEARMAQEIRKLLHEGKDSQQVARELNLGVGEVELIRRLSPDKK